MFSGKRWMSGALLAVSLAVSPQVGLAVAGKAAGKEKPAVPVASGKWAQADKEAVELLGSYLKINTTNPPGNEKLGADFLAQVLRDNGIEAQVFTAAENRACVYARLKGSGKKKPIVLLNHIDVVPAKAEDWKHPPFSGEIFDGEIWGRGTLDMKGMAIAELEAMLMLKRSGKTLSRDIIFLGTPDEEVGGKAGAEWFVQHHGELVKDAEFLLNEGFYIDTTNEGKPAYWGVDVAEKSILWLRLTAKGDAGHASMPMADSAPNRLVRALNRVVSEPAHPVILPSVREYFKNIAKSETGPLKAAYADIDAAVAKPEVLSQLLLDRLKSPMLRNTISLTVLQSGYKTNVIPAEATAELDCRLLPAVKKDDFIAEVKKIVADPSVDVAPIDWVHADASPYDTEMFKTITAIAAKEMPGVPVVPLVVPWFTDSHFFRELGITSYGFEPFVIDHEHLASVHGKDERVPVKTFTDGVHLLYTILEQMQ